MSWGNTSKGTSKWFGLVKFSLQKQNINTPLKTTEAEKAVPRAFHLQQ